MGRFPGKRLGAGRGDQQVEMSEVDLEGSTTGVDRGGGRLGKGPRLAAFTLPPPPRHTDTLARGPAQTNHGLSGVKRRP